MYNYFWTVNLQVTALHRIICDSKKGNKIPKTSQPVVTPFPYSTLPIPQTSPPVSRLQFTPFSRFPATPGFKNPQPTLYAPTPRPFRPVRASGSAAAYYLPYNRQHSQQMKPIRTSSPRCLYPSRPQRTYRPLLAPSTNCSSDKNRKAEETVLID